MSPNPTHNHTHALQPPSGSPLLSFFTPAFVLGERHAAQCGQPTQILPRGNAAWFRYKNFRASYGRCRFQLRARGIFAALMSQCDRSCPDTMMSQMPHPSNTKNLIPATNSVTPQLPRAYAKSHPANYNGCGGPITPVVQSAYWGTQSPRCCHTSAPSSHGTVALAMLIFWEWFWTLNPDSETGAWPPADTSTSARGDMRGRMLGPSRRPTEVPPRQVVPCDTGR